MFCGQGSIYHVKKIPPLHAFHYNRLFEFNNDVSLTSLSLLPEIYDASSKGTTWLLVNAAVSWKVICFHPWMSASRCPTAFFIQNLGGSVTLSPSKSFSSQTFDFYKGQTPHFCFPLKVVPYFLCGSYSQSQWFSKNGKIKPVVTYSPFQLWTKYFPSVP